MKKIVVLFLFVAIACSKNPVKEPKKLLDETTMENILFDVAVMQAALANSPQVLQNNNINHKDYIYKKYKIDSITFHENNKYYAGDVRKFKHLHKRILDRLNNLNKTK